MCCGLVSSSCFSQMFPFPTHKLTLLMTPSHLFFLVVNSSYASLILFAVACESAMISIKTTRAKFATLHDNLLP